MNFLRRAALVVALVAPALAGPARADVFSCTYFYFVPDGSASPIEIDLDNLDDLITTFYLAVSDDIHPGVWYWLSLNGQWFVINDTWTSVPGGEVLSATSLLEAYESLKGRPPSVGQVLHYELALTSSAVTRPNVANTYCSAEIRMQYGPPQETIGVGGVDIDWNHYRDRKVQTEDLPSTR